MQDYAHKINRKNSPEKSSLFEDINIESWANIISLADSDTVKRLAKSHLNAKVNFKRLFIVFEKNRILKAYTAEKSPPGISRWEGPGSLEDMARRTNVDSVVAMEHGFLERISKRFRQKSNKGDDPAKNIIEIYDSMRAEMGQGLHVYPNPKLQPIPNDAIQMIFKFMMRDSGTILFYLFDENKIWGSLIVAVKSGKIDLFTSHDALVGKKAPIVNWRKDYKKVISTVSEIFRKPTIGFFSDLKAFAKMARAAKGLSVLKESRRKKDIIIEPLPLWIESALGAGRLIGL